MEPDRNRIASLPSILVFQPDPKLGKKANRPLLGARVL